MNVTVKDPFVTVYSTGNPRHGIAEYSLRSPANIVFAFDYTSTSKPDDLILHRPGYRILFIVQNTNGFFTQVFGTGTGIDEYDLRSGSDRAMAFDTIAPVSWTISSSVALATVLSISLSAKAASSKPPWALTSGTFAARPS